MSAKISFGNLVKVKLALPKVSLPERLKGTILEKWTNYWKTLYIDYYQGLKDLRSDMQDNPQKAITYTGALIAAYLLNQNVPNDNDFKDELRTVTNEIILLNNECVNPEALEHVRKLQMYYNEGVLRYNNFGIVSFMYQDEYNQQCDLYKVHCKYLQKSYFSILDRIVDVGFMGKWWNLHIKTCNYDVKF